MKNVLQIVLIVVQVQLATDVSMVMYFQMIKKNVQLHVHHHVPLVILQIQTNVQDVLQEPNSIKQPQNVLKI